MFVNDFRILLSCFLPMMNHVICSQINGYHEIQWNSRRKGDVFQEIWDLNFIDCVEHCLRRKRCLSINYSRSKLHCELNSEDHHHDISYALSVNVITYNGLVDVEEDGEYLYSQMSRWNKDIIGSCANHDCDLNERCVAVKGTTRHTCKISECSFPPSFLNADLEIEPNIQSVIGIGSVKGYQLKEGYLSTSNNVDFQMSCQDDGIWADFQSGNSMQIPQCEVLKQSSVIESVKLDTKYVRIPVVVEEGEKWMMIQRRCTGTVNFNRTKVEYKTGFGSLESEFWIGIEAIHRLTAEGYHSLHIELLADDIRYFGQYSWFNVESEANDFRVQFDRFTGNISDTLSYFNGMKFSTWDDDNDKSTINCALKNNGGGWFNVCHQANVNGLYGEKSVGGLSWLLAKEHWIYPSRLIMMVHRP